MVGRWISFWETIFAGAMLVLGRVRFVFFSPTLQLYLGARQCCVFFDEILKVICPNTPCNNMSWLYLHNWPVLEGTTYIFWVYGIIYTCILKQTRCKKRISTKKPLKNRLVFWLSKTLRSWCLLFFMDKKHQPWTMDSQRRWWTSTKWRT